MLSKYVVYLRTRGQSDDEVHAEQSGNKYFPVAPDDGILVAQCRNDCFRPAELCALRNEEL